MDYTNKKVLSWQKPIIEDTDLLKKLRLDHYLAGMGSYNAIYFDPKTREQYFVKRYRRGTELRARNEAIGLTLCSAYGALTPGFCLFYEDKIYPVLVQRLVPISKTVGDLFREHLDQHSYLPDKEKRTELLSSLTTRQITEVIVCWILDYLTFNWDPQPDNYLLDWELLIAVDKEMTGRYIGHPHLLMDSPAVNGDRIEYISKLSKPRSNAMGNIYEPVFTNIYRGVYKPDLEHIKSIVKNVHTLGDKYDEEIRSVLNAESFRERRQTLDVSLAHLFKILGLQYLL